MLNQVNLHNKVRYIVLDAVPLLYRECIPSIFNNSLQDLHHKEQKIYNKIIILEETMMNLVSIIMCDDFVLVSTHRHAY